MEEINSFINNLNVLYVECDEKEKIKIEKGLSKKFNSLRICSTGIEAYEQYKTNNFDIIISAIKIPEMDGIELLEKIRESDNNTPCIFTTSILTPQQMVKVVDLHIDSYVLKPVNIDLLERKVNKVCNDLYYKINYENQKRTQSKKIIEQVASYKINLSTLENNNKVLEETIEKLKSYFVFITEINTNNKKKINQLLSQVDAYENNNTEVSKLELMMKQDKNKQFTDMYNTLSKTKNTNNKLTLKINKIEKQYENQSKLFEELKDKETNKDKRINDLLDLVSNLEKELEEKRDKQKSA